MRYLLYIVFFILPLNLEAKNIDIKCYVTTDDGQYIKQYSWPIGQINKHMQALIGQESSIRTLTQKTIIRQVNECVPSYSRFKLRSAYNLDEHQIY